LQRDAWFAKANARTHKTLRARPIDRLAEEREVMRRLPGREPDTDRRWVTRVAPDPHVRLDTNDYSLDPNLVGRRVEVRASQREITAVALDSGELACRHKRAVARHRTITALEHARTLRVRRGQRDSDASRALLSRRRGPLWLGADVRARIGHLSGPTQRHLAPRPQPAGPQDRPG
jgi:hypothetical protein